MVAYATFNNILVNSIEVNFKGKKNRVPHELSEYCIAQDELIFSYIVARTNYILMR